MLKWYEETGDNSDVVISTRVGLARNLVKYPFPNRLTDEAAEGLVGEIKKELTGFYDGEENYTFCDLSEISELDRTAMVERHIISPMLAAKKQKSGLLISENEADSIMINEEDHIRIQALTSGMNMEKACRKANRMDDLTYEKLHYAYDKKYGYLTACPSNAGTGLRASYMVFLPALSSGGKIQKLVDEMGRYGVVMRGMYGEGSKSLAGIYQITNQKTLGASENDIIGNLNSIVLQVIKQERKRREYMLSNQYDQVEDQIYRSYGVLKYAKQINSVDSMALLAQIKFGVDAGIIHFDKKMNFYKMIMEIQPANLQCRTGRNIGTVVREKARAEYFNKNLPGMID